MAKHAGKYKWQPVSVKPKFILFKRNKLIKLKTIQMSQFHKEKNTRKSELEMSWWVR